MALDIGTEAPDFELPFEPGGDPVRLSDHRGEKVVLLFFPLAFSSVCTEEMCAVAERHDAYRALDARVLGISVDSPFVNRRFAAECGADFPILSDFNREVARSYDVLNPDFYGLRNVSHRAVFILDREGTIRWAWMSEDAGVMPDLEAVREVLARID